MTFALVHSPFLGPSSWALTQAALTSDGEVSRVLDLRGAFAAKGNFYAAFGALAARQIENLSVLVAHSGAGALVPSIWTSAGSRVQGAVFVDGLMPHPGQTWFDTAPIALADRVRAEAAADFADTWPRWMSPSVLARLVPQRSMRERLAADASGAPIAFLEEPAPLSPELPRAACAYLQLSAGYNEDASRARALGWHVKRLDGHHLSIMTDAEPVAAAIIHLAAGLGS